MVPPAPDVATTSIDSAPATAFQHTSRTPCPRRARGLPPRARPANRAWREPASGARRSPRLGVPRSECGVLDIERRHTTEFAAVLRVVKRPRTMHGGAVVPNHEVSDAPRVAVDELRLRGVFHEVTQEESPLRDWPVDDSRRVRCEVQRPTMGARDQADEGMDRAGQ